MLNLILFSPTYGQNQEKIKVACIIVAKHGMSFRDFNAFTGLLNKMLIKYYHKDTLNVYFEFLNVVLDMLLMKNIHNIYEIIIHQALYNY